MSPPGKARAREAGTTLLELIVALAVLALLVSITAVSMGAGARAPSFRAETATIVRALKTAQAEAIAANGERVFVLDVDAKAWSAGCCEAGAIDQSFAVALRLDAGERVSSGRGQIRFYPDGSSSGGILTLERGGTRREIRTDWVSGLITVADAAP